MEADQATATHSAPIRFSGNASEYFKIWIVNTALTVVTLGIYSPWAKVRKLRYFYTNTSLEDGHFDYHANPKAILIGRLMALGMVGIYLASGYIYPVLPFVVIAVIVLLIPWLVVRSRIFQLRNTSYHGLRFDFQRNYEDSFKAYYGGALITVVTLGFGAPTAIYMRNKFVANNAGFGQTQFVFNGRQGQFYAIIWKSIGLAILAIIALSLMVLIVGMSGILIGEPNPGGDSTNANAFSLYSIATTIVLLAVYAAIGIYVQVRLRNYVWNTTELSDTRFLSTLSVIEMVGLYLTNGLAIIFSLGLLVPWAQVRIAKYRADHLEVNLGRDWQDHIAALTEEGSALGEEVGEVFDVDVDVAF